MRLMKVAGIVALVCYFSWAEFNPSRFNFGADWEFASKNGRLDELKNALDYVTIWCNEPAFLSDWHGAMVKYCKTNGQTPVFYGYLIAKLSGLGDSDVGGKLDQEGGAWLRSNISKVAQTYESYAQKIADIYGAGKPTIWLMEPDYFQYCNGSGNDVSVSDAVKYMGQMIAAVKKYLPNAVFSLDISPWNNNQDSYVKSFDLKLFSFMHTSGGRTEAGGDRIRYDNNNNVTWGQVNSASGLCIIADDGYGRGGAVQGHAADWDDANNLKNRMRNGVVAITQKDPKAGWASTINSLKSSLSSETTKCSGLRFSSKYTLTIDAGTNGKITKSPDAATYDSGVTVTLTAVPNSGYKLKNWSGDATGTGTTVTVVMTGDKAVTAAFVDVNAKPTYILTLTTTGSGVIKPDPDKVDFDSGTTVTLEAFVANEATFNGWGGALSGNNPLVTLVMNGNKTVTASFTGSNITTANAVKNGDFSDGAVGWMFGAYEATKATGAVADGGYKVTIQTTGTEGWQIQLMQEGISLVQGKTYELTFTASSPSASSMIVNIGMAVDPFTSYVQKTVSLTSTADKYSYTFAMKKESTTDARFEINCGKSSGTIQLDNISVKEAIELGAGAPRRSVFSPMKLLVDNGEHASVSWYDHAGRLLRSSSGDYGTVVRQKGYNLPGSYIAVLRVGSRQFVRRIVSVGR